MSRTFDPTERTYDLTDWTLPNLVAVRDGRKYPVIARLEAAEEIRRRQEENK